MIEGPRIYNLFPLLAGPLPRWTPHLRRARGMEFNWILVNAFHQAGYSGSLYSVKDYYAVDGRLLEGDRPPTEQLRGMLAEAEGLGMAVMMDLVINHTAFDSPLVARHPHWFVRDADGRIVHPGATDGQERVVWRDLAQVDNAASPDREALWAYWRDLALHYAGMGFRGFRCDAAYQVPPDLWRHLIRRVKAEHPDVRFFAETLGCTPEETLDTAAAGFDFIFNSSKWWDFREPWCLEQYAETAPMVPSISFPESHDTPRLAEELKGDRAALLQRYAFAAMFSTGVMMPVGYEFGFRRRLHVVETTPADWEAPRWDATCAIAAVNRTKAACPALNEEGILRPVDLGEPRAVGLLKRTRDRRQWLLAALNLDEGSGVALRIPPEVTDGHPLAWTDPGTGRSGPLDGAAGLALRPSGLVLVHPVEAGGPSAGAAGARGELLGRRWGAGIS
jgi:starch synthase (maltosyl-transferring)